MCRRLASLFLLSALLVTACSRTDAVPAVGSPSAPPAREAPAPPVQTTPPAPPPWKVTAENLSQVAAQHHPNEAGRVLILEYHHFGEKEERWTRTYPNFKGDLQTLYDQGYRAVNLVDYIGGKLDLPAGKSPVVFTFDDSLESQFRLVEKDGKLEPAPDTAVAIMLDFAKQHPDFGLAGTFYVNLTNPFPGAGTVADRFKFLIDHGFEIGNHTWSHEDLSSLTPEQVQSTLARQAAEIARLVPGYEEQTMALPFGLWPKEHKLAYEGEYKGMKYHYKAVLLVGAEPAPSPFSKNFDPLALPRVQATNTDHDFLNNWLSNLKTSRYVSDGDPQAVVVPRADADRLSPQALGQRQVLSY